MKHVERAVDVALVRRNRLQNRLANRRQRRQMKHDLSAPQRLLHLRGIPDIHPPQIHARPELLQIPRMPGAQIVNDGIVSLPSRQKPTDQTGADKARSARHHISIAHAGSRSASLFKY